jgi:hypothetical protein
MEAPGCPFATLPIALVQGILMHLPVDARLRAAEVCRGWRAALRERSLWLRLDVSSTAGLARPATDALLRAAAARAHGQLHALDVSERERLITPECRLAVVYANRGALRELRAWVGHRVFLWAALVDMLLRAAPQLRVFDADVLSTGAAAAHSMLRNEAPFAPLRLRRLEIFFDGQTEASVLSLAADLTAHPSLVEVILDHAPLDTPAALDAIVAAALANRFSQLTLSRCHLSPASAPALARLLGGGALRTLSIENDNETLLHPATAAVLGDALRANCTLEELHLSRAELWQWNGPAVAATLIGSITGHRSLRRVSLFNNHIRGAQDAVGAALGALVAADAPALAYLEVVHCGWQEAALGPLVDALPANTHLHTLLLSTVIASAAFLRNRLLPAVRANTSLRHLGITVRGEGEHAAREAQEIVNSRAAR